MNGSVKIPVVIITGFLGSGKTTLIGEMLRQPGFDGTLVVVNEFGEIGIDHDLLESSSEDIILLANGCLCCTIRGNLVDTLDSALVQHTEGRLRSFDRIVVETSGLADPAPFLAFLYEQEQFLSHFSIAGVVTVCDATALEITLKRFPEAVSQVRMADRIVISKSDLASPHDIHVLEQMIRAINSDAELHQVVMGNIDPFKVFELHRLAPPAQQTIGRHHDHGEGTETSPVRHLGIERLTFTLPPLKLGEIEVFIQALRLVTGPHLLRVKGLLRLKDDERIAVVQGTMTAIAPPQFLPMQTEGEGRLVFLLQGASATQIVETLLPFGGRLI